MGEIVVLFAAFDGSLGVAGSVGKNGDASVNGESGVMS